MKVGYVVGKVTLLKPHSSVAGKRWVIALPQPLAGLAGAPVLDVEETIVIDEIGANEGSWIGFSDGAEAAQPFLPKQVPVDAYVACVLDTVEVDAEAMGSLTG